MKTPFLCFRAALCPLALAVATIATVLTGAASAATLRSQLYVGGFTSPIAFVQDPSNPNIQFVAEQGGRIRVIQNGALVATPFLDLTAAILAGGERGLLGLAFAPNYATSRRFFVYFTRAVDGHVVVARFTRSAGNPLTADSSSRFDLTWSTGLNYIFHPYSNHNGGNIAFGPDGYLYIGTGDGGSGGDPENRAQNPDELLGKMLRIDVNVPDSNPQGFVVPADNPFLDNLPIPARPEIWAFGLRNPWRWSFDDPAHGGTGALVIGDVGQSNWEEIDYEPANRGGRNYGWRIREGSHVFINATPPYGPLTNPIFEMDRTLATSVTGGVVYRGSLLGSQYAGRYFFANFYGNIYSLTLTIDPITGEATASNFTEHTSEVGSFNTSSFGVDSAGELYIVSWGSGEIYRVLPVLNTPTAATQISPSGLIGTATPTYTWNAVATSTDYYLWVTDRIGVRIQQWYTAAAAGCGGGTGLCSVTPATPVATGTAVNWWIQTWNQVGFGPWSSGLSFTPSMPPALTLVSPAGSVPTSTPAYTWNASPLASYYRLWLNDGGAPGGPGVQHVLGGDPPQFDQWYSAAAVGCPQGTGTCTLTPYRFGSPIRLPPGGASWWIQAWNDVGYGPWSAEMRFTVAPPGAATLVSPTGSIATNMPTYTWNAVPTATHYYVWVNDSSMMPRVQIWFTAAAAGCPSGTGTCSVTPAVALASGAATWWIQTWNDAGFGPWSSGMAFSVQ